MGKVSDKLEHTQQAKTWVLLRHVTFSLSKPTPPSVQGVGWAGSAHPPMFSVWGSVEISVLSQPWHIGAPVPTRDLVEQGVYQHGIQKGTGVQVTCHKHGWYRQDQHRKREGKECLQEERQVCSAGFIYTSGSLWCQKHSQESDNGNTSKHVHRAVKMKVKHTRNPMEFSL